MNQQVNPYVSVDCVLLGFDGKNLNALIIRDKGQDNTEEQGTYKLPGSVIFFDEDLDEAAQRVLKNMTGLVQVNMMQFHAFGGAHRLINPSDSVWLERFYNLGHNVDRIVTIGYVALLRIDRKKEHLKEGYEAQWIPVNDLPKMAFDHNEIVVAAVTRIKKEATLNPTLIFDLLPRKFTASQLRVVMETVLGVKFDIKNFHKKLAQMPYVIPLDEKEDGVSHRAARYFKYKKPRKTF